MISPKDKIFNGPSGDQFTNLLAGYRRERRIIVLAPGCWDLLHCGHVGMLNWVRQCKWLAPCKRLIVAVADDDHVCKLKGEDRPLVTGWQRAYMLAALFAVDAVVLHDGDVYSLIDDVKPDVLVKGAEYRLSPDLIGAKKVEGYGGLVFYAPMTPDVSTSLLSKQLRDGK